MKHRRHSLGSNFPALSFSSSYASVPESGGAVRLTLQRTGGTDNAVTAQVIEDGSFELPVTAPGPPTYYLNRITPTSYPTTLSGVSVWFSNQSQNKVGDAIHVVVATDTSSGQRLNGLPFQRTSGNGDRQRCRCAFADDTWGNNRASLGTGLRHHSGLTNVMVTVGGTLVPVLHADKQPEFIGLDQINVQLPRHLYGRGETEIVVTVDGRVANPVKINFR